MPAFRDVVTGPATVRSAAELDHRAFFRSALYNEIWRPQGLHRQAPGGGPGGAPGGAPGGGGLPPGIIMKPGGQRPAGHP